MNTGTNQKYKFEKYDVFFIRLCTTQTTDYMKCLHLQNEKPSEQNNCEEIRTKYLSCINDNRYIIQKV